MSSTSSPSPSPIPEPDRPDESVSDPPPPVTITDELTWAMNNLESAVTDGSEDARSSSAKYFVKHGVSKECKV